MWVSNICSSHLTNDAFLCKDGFNNKLKQAFLIIKLYELLLILWPKKYFPFP